jgi:hypothetical protein
MGSLISHLQASSELLYLAEQLPIAELFLKLSRERACNRRLVVGFNEVFLHKWSRLRCYLIQSPQSTDAS